MQDEKEGLQRKMD
jgi:dynein heavy chain